MQLQVCLVLGGGVWVFVGLFFFFFLKRPTFLQDNSVLIYYFTFIFSERGIAFRKKDESIG